MNTTITTPTNRGLLKAACEQSGMSDGAWLVFEGYFDTVVTAYNALLVASQQPEPETPTTPVKEAKA